MGGGSSVVGIGWRGAVGGGGCSGWWGRWGAGCGGGAGGWWWCAVAGAVVASGRPPPPRPSPLGHERTHDGTEADEATRKGDNTKKNGRCRIPTRKRVIGAILRRRDGRVCLCARDRIAIRSSGGATSTSPSPPGALSSSPRRMARLAAMILWACPTARGKSGGRGAWGRSPDPRRPARPQEASGLRPPPCACQCDGERPRPPPAGLRARR